MIRTRLLGSFFLFGVTSTLMVLGLEVVLRVLALQSIAIIQPDRYTGWAHIPGVSGTFLSGQGKNHLSINELGLVGGEVSLEKVPGKQRLLLIGDSFTESAQVPFEQTWGSRLDARLGASWEVLNGGVSGYGTSHSALYLESRGWTMQPDAVFLLFFTGNDVSDSSKALGVERGWQAQPYFELSSEDQNGLVLRDHPLPLPDSGLKVGVKNWLRANSRLYLFVRDRLYLAKAIRNETDSTEKSTPRTWDLYRRETGPKWEEAWALTDRLLLRIAEDCRRQGVPFGVGILPTGWRIDPAQKKKLLQDYPSMADSTVWDFASPDRRLIQILDGHEIPYIHLTPALEKIAPTSEPLYSDHLTDLGHEVVASEIAVFLRQLLPPK